MFLPKFCVDVALVLLFPLCTRQQCTEGTPKQCQEADFAPGTNLAGEGFDITKMERKGAFVLDMNQWKNKKGKCMLCLNKFMGNTRQKLPSQVQDWRAQQTCSSKVSSSLHKSSESLVHSGSTAVENNWKVDLNFQTVKTGGSLMLAGTNSKLSDYSMGRTKNDKYNFASQSMFCEYYRYGVSSTPKMQDNFNRAVKQLPKIYNADSKQSFYRLIDNFGTHYITKVKLGGMVTSVTSIRQCQASLQGLSSEEVQMCLEVEASASARVSVSTESKHCKKDIESSESKAAFSSVFSDRFTEIKGGIIEEPDLLFSADKNPDAYKTWLNSIPQNPDIMSYSLNSLHQLFPVNSTNWSNLRSAITHYILEKGLWRNCSERCQVGIKSDSKDSCVCQCHNNPAVNLDCCPTRKGTAQVVLTVKRAEGLWGDYFTATDGFVKVYFNSLKQSTNVISNNNNPTWNFNANLGSQDLSFPNKVKLEVWDEDSGWDDDLLGTCDVRLSAGTREEVCNLRHGRLFYKWEVKCAPSLSGSSCSVYKATPMNQSLRKFYVSRHSRPIPKAILKEMGVFVNESVSTKPKFSLLTGKTWKKNKTML